MVAVVGNDGSGDCRQP